MSTTLARKSAEKGLLTAAGWTLRRGLIWLLGPLLAGVAGTNLLTAVAYGVVIQVRTLSRRATHELDQQAYKVETACNIGWAGGAFLGMSAGALLGSFVPVLGNLVLSLALGGVGGLVGALV